MASQVIFSLDEMNKYLDKLAEQISAHNVHIKSFTDRSGGQHMLMAMRAHNNNTYIIHVSPQGKLTHSTFPGERRNLRNTVSNTRKGILKGVSHRDEKL